MQQETSANRRAVHALAGTAAVEERMSQRDVERTLGRLLTDQGFQDNFFLDPVHACLQTGVQLTPHEVEALLRAPRPALTQLARSLDDRICRLHIQRSEIARQED
jgi:hypothetical protein